MRFGPIDIILFSACESLSLLCKYGEEGCSSVSGWFVFRFCSFSLLRPIKQTSGVMGKNLACMQPMGQIEASVEVSLAPGLLSAKGALSRLD